MIKQTDELECEKRDLCLPLDRVVTFGLWLVLQFHHPNPSAQTAFRNLYACGNRKSLLFVGWLLTVPWVLLALDLHRPFPVQNFSEWFFMYIWLMVPISEVGIWSKFRLKYLSP